MRKRKHSSNPIRPEHACRHTDNFSNYLHDKHAIEKNKHIRQIDEETEKYW